MSTLRITSSLAIDESHLDEAFVRASGPGGQNVNKVATAVQLRFDLGASDLPESVKERTRRLAGSRLLAGDIVLIEARRFRTQERNRQDARDRLVALLARAATPPRPRRKTKPSRAQRLRRLSDKKRRSDRKRLRRRPADD